ncbi:GNAT family N-acetyltransferase [Rhizobium sp. 1399]|uniref:GNAT family N-acetyltransferase n=1 Tax=Rhizobium sp. 1399 TaxID=2817758 RepID=UPI0028570F72|nr:GNAT family N-acetyltransferase [Rhizobium sp. 1399]MDR6670155.1 RimJ/RimL family protein N-acetyltransferase [Rhizobium sp. 1399]
MTRTDGITIRRLSADELDLYRAIRLEALRSEPSSFATTIEDWLRLSREEWLARMASAVFVAFEENEPVGMMGLSRQMPSKMNHRARLVGVYLRKNLRGSGVAADLLDAVCDHAKSIGIQQLELTVSAEVARALRFYERHGFEAVGRVPNALRDEGEIIDELIMIRRLNE